MIEQKKFLVSEVTKENKDKIKLKSLRLGVSIDELTILAIDVFDPEIKCRGCNNTNPVTNIEHEYFVGGQKIVVTVNNVPTEYCSSCVKNDEETLFDFKLLHLIKEKVEEITLRKYIRTKITEFTINYKDLEKIESTSN